MPKLRFTDRSLKALKPKEQRIDYFDAALPGFGLRVTANGIKSWCVMYRHGGRLRRYTFGTFPLLGLANARECAMEALREARLGGDPGAVKQVSLRADTFAQLAEQYLELYAKRRKKSWQLDERRINNVLVPRFGRMHAKAVTRADVRILLDEIAERAPIEANRTLALVRKIFSWALSLDLVETSPCLGIPQPALENKRERTLTDDEIRAVWSAFETEGERAGPIFQLRLITGQRGMELARMKWEDIDEKRWWMIPGTETKNRATHRVWFSGPAWRILNGSTRHSVWVFPDSKTDQPLESVSKALARVRTQSGVDFQARDLRRTMATRMAEAGVDLRTVDRILNHKEKGIIRIYNRYEFDKEKREAWKLWARKLTKLLSGLLEVPQAKASRRCR
jgi:integrase